MNSVYHERISKTVEKLLEFVPPGPPYPRGELQKILDELVTPIVAKERAKKNESKIPFNHPNGYYVVIRDMGGVRFVISEVSYKKAVLIESLIR